MSDSEEGRVKDHDLTQNIALDEEVADTQGRTEVDTLPSSEQAVLHSSCDTNMSHQSDNEEQEDPELSIAKYEVTKSSIISSSIEVEANDTAHNLSSPTTQMTEKGSTENLLVPVSEVTRSDSFNSSLEVEPNSPHNISSPISQQSPRKRKERSRTTSPPQKKARNESLETSNDKSLPEVVFEGIVVKREEHPVMNISSTSEKTIYLDDSEEFSLRVEETSPPSQLNDKKTGGSHEIDPWKSHSADRNISPGGEGIHGNLSQKSGISWSSHNHNESLSWSSHKDMEGRYTAIINELTKEITSLRNAASLSAEITRGIDLNAEIEGKSIRMVTEERLMFSTIQCTIDDKTNKVLSAKVTQMSPIEEVQSEKSGRFSITSHKSSSSSGSVGLPGPFPLPGYTRDSIMSSLSSSSGASRPGWDGPFLKPSVPGTRTVLVDLTCGYCNKIFPHVERTSSPIMNGSPKLLEEEALQIDPVTIKRSKKRLMLSSTLEEETSSSESQPQAASTPTPTKGRGRQRKNNSVNIHKTPNAEIVKSEKGKSFTPIKKNEKGEAVFARWADGRYYPGWVSQSSCSSNQAMVHFCDGKSKLTPMAKVVRADVVIAGTLVLAATDTGEYEEALIVQVTMPDTEVHYTVERDSVTRQVQFTGLALLESQVLELTMTDAQKAAASLINFNDVSLDNILSHPRKRSARTPLTKITQVSPTTPNSKKKKRQVTPEPSTSHGQTFGGPDDYYIDTDSSTHSTCSVDIRGKEVRPLDMECSPPEMDTDSRCKLSLYRRNMTTKSKKRKDESDFIVKLLGPIPEAGSELFSGCVFLITYTSKVVLRSNFEAGSSEIEDASDGVRVNKERLRTQIKSGGGKLYTALNQVSKDELPNTYLITDKPCNTPLYLQCLVNSIPIYSLLLIRKCCSQNRSFKEMIGLRSVKKMSAGYSLAKKCLVNPRSTQPLRDKSLLLALSGEPSLALFWENLIRKMGGKSEIYSGGCLVEQRFDIIVTDSECEQDLVAQACEQKVPLVSLTWLQQCIINGEYRSPTEHPLYKYNSTFGQDSPEY